MRTPFAAVLVSFVLAGCGAEQSETPQYEPASPELQSSTSDAASPSEPASGDVIQAPLEAIGLVSPLSIRYDRIGKTKEGANQRQVYVEMLGATVEQTEAVTSQTLEAAGFTVRRGLSDQNGIRLQYKKAGTAPLNVLIRDKAASSPFKNPAATSSLYIKQDVL